MRAAPSLKYRAGALMVKTAGGRKAAAGGNVCNIQTGPT
jgi:hypothetical protein